MQLNLFERLALGTAQFGLAYGVTNSSGQVPLKEVRSILGRAAQVGVQTLDTAALYGESETALGNAGVKDFTVVTKLPALGDNLPDVSLWVANQLTASLHRLQVDRVHGLLLHRPATLLGPAGPAIWSAMQALRDEGRVSSIGYSVYAPDELSTLYPAFPADLVQLPYNVFDRRFETSDWLQRLYDNGTAIHSRSAFLQGLLLSPVARPAKFDRWQTLFRAWDNWCRAQGKSALEATLSHSLAHPAIDRVLVGVAGRDQFDQILASVPDRPQLAPMVLASEDLDLVDPSRWSSL